MIDVHHIVARSCWGALNIREPKIVSWRSNLRTRTDARRPFPRHAPPNVGGGNSLRPLYNVSPDHGLRLSTKQSTRRSLSPACCGWEERGAIARMNRQPHNNIAYLPDAILHWDYSGNSHTNLLGLKYRRQDDLRLSYLVSGACEGRRGDHHTGLDGGDYIGVSCLLEGRELLEGSGQRVELRPNDTLVWRNEGKKAFCVPEHLAIFTILLPQVRFANYIRGRIPDSHWLMPGDTPIGSMMAAFLKSLASQVEEMPPTSADSAVEMALAMVAHAIDDQSKCDGPARRTTLFRRIISYIDRHLEDSALTPAYVASAHGISTRYLHLLFSNQESTVSGWIRERRLQRCREELECSRRGFSLTEIAYTWGFSDVPHFSRTFKKRFGVSPKVWKSRHMGANVVSLDDFRPRAA